MVQWYLYRRLSNLKYLKMRRQAERDAGYPNQQEINGEPKGQHGPAPGEKAIVLADDPG